MYLQFLGAAGSVTGSKHLINTSPDGQGGRGLQVLLDCGLFQGNKELRERNWQPCPIPANQVDAVVLSHAHLDHTGWLPKLMKEGFRGPIYATPATVDLCGVLLPDSGHLQEEEAEFHNKKKSSKHTPALPLYTLEEARQALGQLRPVEFAQEKQISQELSFRYVPAAHILGSAMVECTLRVDGRTTKLLFSGDIGRVPRDYGRDDEYQPGRVMPGGPAPATVADVVIMESTYGNREHPKSDPRPELARIVRETVARGGSIVVPAFAVERTQKFLFMLKDLMERGEMPKAPVFADSPMAIEAVQIFTQHSKDYNQATTDLVRKYGSPLQWEGFTFARTANDSKKINELRFPHIVVSASGMATGGRVLHHLMQKLPDPRNTVLFIGFQAPGTRGEVIKRGSATVKIFNQEVPIRAHVATLDQFSDHADSGELMQWLKTFDAPPKQIYLVHGEAEAAEALREKIHSELGWKVDVAEYLQRVKL